MNTLNDIAEFKGKKGRSGRKKGNLKRNLLIAGGIVGTAGLIGAGFALSKGKSKPLKVTTSISEPRLVSTKTTNMRMSDLGVEPIGHGFQSRNNWVDNQHRVAGRPLSPNNEGNRAYYSFRDIVEFRQGRKKGSRNKRKKLRVGSSAVAFVPAGAAIGSLGGIVGATLSRNPVRNMKFGVPIATVAGGLTGYGISRVFDKKYKLGAYEK